MTLRLARIDLREIRLPLVEPFRTANGVVDARRIVLLTLTDTDGAVAWSECVAESRPTYSPDTVDSCWLALTEWIVPLALGATFDTPSTMHSLLDRQVRGHHMARAAVEMGAWALEATRRSMPLATLLASEVGATPRDSVETGIALGMQDDMAALVDRVTRAQREGYRRIKLKVEPGRDVEWARAARDAVGASMNLAVDGNCSYSLDNADHAAALGALDSLGLSMIEQPLGHDDLVRHAELQQRMRTPICLDESIRDAASVRSMHALRGGRMVNVKPGRVGGFTEALMIHRTCGDAGIPLWCGGMLECGIGRAYNVALASLPGFTQPGDLSPSARYWERDVVTPAWTMDAGRVRVPLDRTGIGVEVDDGFVDSLTVRASTFTAR